MELGGELPAGVLCDDAFARVLDIMQQGQSFVQYLRMTNGTLVKKHIKLMYVPNETEAEGAGKLYWGDVRLTTQHSNTHCTRNAFVVHSTLTPPLLASD